ncbi:MAG TPA: GNAT family N-acetyltransferase [Methanocella sp.]|uniref:GNAT family N-acetyltransferase n=1 Tax=Methanocella sp. TaxID=2052833 RepID=UPI002CDF6139|nr:GNAT family N-acetyltransferase [Methanocella sp.]HTY91875.1 GNAT family N-acetyltransferase [Methanocella sp.]
MNHNISIEPIGNKSLWDKFIDESPNSLLFHKWDFLKIAEKYTGYKVYAYGFYRRDELISVLPIFHKKRKGMNFVYSPPQTTLSYIPYMGFAFSPTYYHLNQHEKESGLCSMISEMDQVLRGLSANYVSYATVPGDVDSRPYIWNGYEALLQYTYVIDLERPLEAIWEEFDRNCRKRIEAAEKLRPSVIRSDDSGTLFRIMRERFADQGDTFFHRQTPEYLKELLSTFPDEIKMYFIYSGDELIGADVNCEYKDLCMSWMGTAVMKENLNANEYMLWEIIKGAKDAGKKRYENLGADEKRLNDFKAKFNPSLIPYFYIIKKNILYRTTSYIMEKMSKKA